MSPAFFAPHLTVRKVRAAIDFYQLAFEAVVLRTWDNDDGSVHVAELKIRDAIFHLHEEVPGKNQVSPETSNVTTVLIGLFLPDPDLLMERAVKAGARVVNPIQNYDYGYRQGTIQDPFGHQWLLEKKI